MEEHVYFQSGDFELEGMYSSGAAGKGVVITHPHPLYGGDLYSPVVEAIAAAYGKLGFRTLRFNFRGVGKSSGTHDNGEGERTDVLSAVNYMKQQGVGEVHLSGYSFGAWVNAMALQGDLKVDGLTMVAPPVAFIQFKKGLRLPMLSLIVAGSRDEFAPPNLIVPEMDNWNPAARLDVIDGPDHFFFGFLNEVTRRLVEGLPSVGRLGA